MKNKSIIMLALVLSASLSSVAGYAANAAQDDFDARIEQMNKQYETERAEWDKRRNMSLEERRAYDDARWAEWEKRYNEEIAAAEKQFAAQKAEWDKRRNMSLEELRAQDDARWAEIEKQYEAAREQWQNRRDMNR